MPHESVTLADGTTIPVNRHPKCKNPKLKWRPHTGVMTLTAPPWATNADLMRFARAKVNWIAPRLARGPMQTPLEPKAVVPVLGSAHEIVRDGRRSGDAHFGDRRILVPDVEGEAERLVIELLRATVHDELLARVHSHVEDLNPSIPFRRIRVAEQETRWGSASTSGTLSFNWRLVFAPRFVVDYLAAHEAAHLEHMDHGPAFWSACRHLAPHTDEARTWLKRNGGALWSYGTSRQRR